MTNHYLVLFDADKIKDYVFATGRLKEIRGASEQVRQLTEPDPLKVAFREDVKRDLPDWQPGLDEGLIYAGGGAGALLVANEPDAQRFCTYLERTYRRTTGNATLSAVCVPVEYHCYESRTQAEANAQNQAARELARRKASRFQAEAVPGGGFLRFCDSDRLRPANDSSERDLDDPRDRLLLSTASKTKRNKSIESRRSFFTRGQPFWDTFCHLIDQSEDNDVIYKKWNCSIEQSGGQDLGMLGAQAHPDGYVALVYADGDGIGRLLAEVVQQQGFVGYQQFSTALSIAAARSTAQALYAAYPCPLRTGALPFEVITIGGDDVILICTGEYGLEVACTLSRTFAEEMQTLIGKRVTASVGVVIAHDSHPIVNLEQRGRELLKEAKRKAGDGHGGIDFHIVSTPGLGSITALRTRYYAPPGKHQEISFLARPYRQPDMAILLQHAYKLRELPASKRAQLYDACLRSPDHISATLAVLQIQIRLRQTYANILMEALRNLGARILYPFYEDTTDLHRRVTPLVDLLEAAEFVARG